MSNMQTIAALEAEWEPEAGFLWKAREGRFDQTGFERTYRKLQGLDLDLGADIPRRLVSLLWYMPLFLVWQTERVKQKGGETDSYNRAVAAITNEVERLLGVP